MKKLTILVALVVAMVTLSGVTSNAQAQANPAQLDTLSYIVGAELFQYVQHILLDEGGCDIDKGEF